MSVQQCSSTSFTIIIPCCNLKQHITAWVLKGVLSHRCIEIKLCTSVSDVDIHSVHNDSNLIKDRVTHSLVTTTMETAHTARVGRHSKYFKGHVLLLTQIGFIPTSLYSLTSQGVTSWERTNVSELNVDEVVRHIFSTN